MRSHTIFTSLPAQGPRKDDARPRCLLPRSALAHGLAHNTHHQRIIPLAYSIHYPSTPPPLAHGPLVLFPSAPAFPRIPTIFRSHLPHRTRSPTHSAHTCMSRKSPHRPIPVSHPPSFCATSPPSSPAPPAVARPVRVCCSPPCDHDAPAYLFPSPLRSGPARRSRAGVMTSPSSIPLAHCSPAPVRGISRHPDVSSVSFAFSSPQTESHPTVPIGRGSGSGAITRALSSSDTFVRLSLASISKPTAAVDDILVTLTLTERTSEVGVRPAARVHESLSTRRQPRARVPLSCAPQHDVRPYPPSKPLAAAPCLVAKPSAPAAFS
ncbi:hypothetical protein VTO73DRAFT_4811 [Trametes versicolor]